MKQVLIALSISMMLISTASSTSAFNPVKHAAFRSYMPAVGDYVKPKSWSAYPFTYAVWSDPTGNPSPYARWLDWVNKRCLVTALWQVGSQWYVELNIPGTSYTVQWPVNYVTVTPPVTTDLLIQTI